MLELLRVKKGELVLVDTVSVPKGKDPQEIADDYGLKGYIVIHHPNTNPKKEKRRVQ